MPGNADLSRVNSLPLLKTGGCAQIVGRQGDLLATARDARLAAEPGRRRRRPQRLAGDSGSGGASRSYGQRAEPDGKRGATRPFGRLGLILMCLRRGG